MPSFFTDFLEVRDLFAKRSHHRLLLLFTKIVAFVDRFFKENSPLPLTTEGKYGIVKVRIKEP